MFQSLLYYRVVYLSNTQVLTDFVSPYHTLGKMAGVKDRFW